MEKPSDWQDAARDMQRDCHAHPMVAHKHLLLIIFAHHRVLWFFILRNLLSLALCCLAIASAQPVSVSAMDGAWRVCVVRGDIKRTRSRNQRLSTSSIFTVLPLMICSRCRSDRRVITQMLPLPPIARDRTAAPMFSGPYPCRLTFCISWMPRSAMLWCSLSMRLHDCVFQWLTVSRAGQAPPIRRLNSPRFEPCASHWGG